MKTAGKNRIDVMAAYANAEMRALFARYLEELYVNANKAIEANDKRFQKNINSVKHLFPTEEQMIAPTIDMKIVVELAKQEEPDPSVGDIDKYLNEA